MALCYNKTLLHCLLPSLQLCKFRGDLNLFVLGHNLTFFLLLCFFHCNHTVIAFQLGGSKEEQSQKEIAKLYVAFIFICVALFWNPLPPCAPEARKSWRQHWHCIRQADNNCSSLLLCCSLSFLGARCSGKNRFSAEIPLNSFTSDI